MKEEWTGLVPANNLDDSPVTKWTTKDSGTRAEYSSGMVRDSQEGKPRFDLCRAKGMPYLEQMETRWALLMARGAEKYGDFNWLLGDSEEELDRARGSAERHLKQYLNGETDEDHAAAVFANIMFAEYFEWKLKNNQ